ALRDGTHPHLGPDVERQEGTPAKASRLPLRSVVSRELNDLAPFVEADPCEAKEVSAKDGCSDPEAGGTEAGVQLNRSEHVIFDDDGVLMALERVSEADHLTLITRGQVDSESARQAPLEEADLRAGVEQEFREHVQVRRLGTRNPADH